ncbi:MAG: hypothetical protein K1Y01_10795 [Vicinamibacteria bacterium]|nr:hypothetical protein [Vicinamibacteria bacterium]
MKNSRPRFLVGWLAGALLAAPAVAQENSAPAPSPTPAPRFQPEVLKALPTAGSLTARVVQLNSGLVLEREESSGLFPAEPSRFAFRGGSWTQSRFEIDGFDVTDPIFGGRPLVWGAVELGEVDVRTDSKGTVLVHDHPGPVATGRTRVLVQGNLGLFDARGTTKDPIPSLSRGHDQLDGLLAASGASASGATNWSGALAGADVSRSERDSDLERATRRLGFEGRLNHFKGDDRFQGLALVQGRRLPFGFTTGETRSTGLALGAGWTRQHAPEGRFPSLGDRNETTFKASYLRGTTEDPESGSPAVFERLVDGPPDLQVPYRSTAQNLSIEAARRGWNLGDVVSSSLVARFSRSLGERELSQGPFQALEKVDGASARQWTYSAGAPARLAQTRASLSLGLGYSLSARTRLSGVVELERVSVADRDGESLLGSTRVLPDLRFEWTKSETTSFYAEASIATPPTPLATYEAAARNAPSVAARLWRDANGDGRASPAELGIEVARRGPDFITADPELSPPTMRRVIVGFRTRVSGLGIHATAFARRDRNLIETALDPQGSEIGRVRSIPDPSGDILGPSDDQLLPLVEQAARSFTQSRFLLTNPAGHNALGEGAELGFETNAKHVHWGLIGAAFRDSGRGGNRGLRAGENDFGVVGESFDSTNADTYGYGRLFFDRAYSLRMYLTANDVKGFTFGALGRYDDGQPFARLVIRNDLPQGPDFVQAIPRGRARLHYTLSVDARLARSFNAGGARVELSASVFNALGSQFEAEEQIVWRDDYRRITMVQPPRAFVIGVRIER